MPQILYVWTRATPCGSWIKVTVGGGVSPLQAKILGLQGVVPENIHTHPMEGHWKL